MEKVAVLLLLAGVAGAIYVGLNMAAQVPMLI